MAVFVAAACTPPARWQHPGMPKDQWARDISACKRLAAREVEKEFAIGERGIGVQSTYRTQMTRYDAGKRQDALRSRCMRAKGYVRAGG